VVAARENNGQFKKGVSGNPKGRPKKSRETRFYEITMTSCTYADWREIVKTAVKQAKRGDASARKFLADYLIGTPEQNLNLTGNSALDVIVHYVEHSEIS